MTQLHLWDKPFHSITVYERPNPQTGGRSIVVGYDNDDAMSHDIQRILELNQNKKYLRVAYIMACATREDILGHKKVVCLATCYPEP